MSREAASGPLGPDRVARVLESAPDALIVVDGRQQMVFISRRVAELFGYSGHELIGRPLALLLPDDALSSDGVVCISRQVLGRRRDGTGIQVEASVAGTSFDGCDYRALILRNASVTARAEILLRAVSEILHDTAHGDRLALLPGSLLRATQAEACFVAVGGSGAWRVYTSWREAPLVMPASAELLTTARSVPSLRCLGDLHARFPRADWLVGEGQHLVVHRAVCSEREVVLVGIRGRSPFSSESGTLVRLYGLAARADVSEPGAPPVRTTRPPHSVPPAGRDPSASFVDLLPTPTFVGDEFARRDHANQGWDDLIGTTGDEPENERWLDAVHAGDRPAAESTWHRSVATGTRFRQELRIVRKPDGQTTWVLAEGSPQWHAKKPRWIVTFTDITAQRAIAADLRTTQQQLADAQRIARLGHWRWHPGTDGLMWSTEAAAMLGVPSHTSRDGFLRRFVADDTSRTQMLNALRIALRGGEVQPFELVLRRDGTRNLVVRVRAEAVCDCATSEPMEVVGTMQDVTREHEIEQHLRETQRLEAMGRLSGGIAHDFNNMLTVISGAAMLLADAEQSSSQRELLGDIVQAAERSTALTRQLLAFGRRQVLEPRALLLSDVFDNLSRVLPRLFEGRVDLELDVPAELTCFVDEAQLEQVIVNLAVNARDAISEEGKVSFAADAVRVRHGDALHRRGVRPRTYVRLQVSDDGAGIPDDVRPHIFEPFFTTKGPDKGSGLGLATVRGILEQSKGTILVDTERGTGTTFSVFLPAAPGARSERPPSAPHRPTPAPEDALVVAVDDEPMVLRTLTKVLRDAGYGVASFAHGAEACEYFKRGGHADVVLTDVHMPVMDGPGLAAWVEQTMPGLPVLFITGYAHHPAITRGAAMGTIQVLPKPVSVERLTEAIASAIVRSPRRRDRR